jgi:hypothetical protein
MKWNVLIKKARYYLQYFPFTLNAFVIGIVLWLCFQWLKPGAVSSEGDTESFVPIILLIGKTALWFIIALILFSILSTFFCWILFLIQKNRNGYQLDIKFEPLKKGKGLWLETMLQKARRPFLGFIKGKLFYDDLNVTDTFILASNERVKKQFWRLGVKGKSKLALPDIREYAIVGGFVFFEDMLQIFSLPVKQTIKGHFYQSPENIALQDDKAQPRKTEETETRIEQMRKVQGEYLNYKDFESGDDVRRVVWKVYAKNRELMVRIPEIFDPYASHIYFYASFYSTEGPLQNDFVNEMLNYYKNRVWSVYEPLSVKEFDVKFIPDQSLQLPEQINKNLFVQRIISNSDWQSETSLSDYFDIKHGAVLCISSLSDLDEVKSVVENCNSEVVVYYVKLSDTFRSFAPWAWFTRIFFLPPEDRLRRIRSRWALTPLRWKLVKREKQMEAILNAADITLVKL